MHRFGWTVALSVGALVQCATHAESRATDSIVASIKKPVATFATGNASDVVFGPRESVLATYRRLPTSMFGRAKYSDLRVWDVSRGNLLLNVADTLHGFAFSADDTMLATWNKATVSVADTRTGKIVASLKHENVRQVQFLKGVNQLATISDPHFLITPSTASSHPQTCLIWDTATWQRTDSQIDHLMPLHHCVISPDGRFLAGSRDIEGDSGGQSQTDKFKLWEIATARELSAPDITPSPKSVSFSAFTSDGGKLGVIFCENYGDPRQGSIHVWDVSKSQEIPFEESYDFMKEMEWYSLHLPFPFRMSSVTSFPRIRGGKVEILEPKFFYWEEEKIVATLDIPDHLKKSVFFSVAFENVLVLKSSTNREYVASTPDRKRMVTEGASPKICTTTILDLGTGRELTSVEHEQPWQLMSYPLFHPNGKVFVTLTHTQENDLHVSSRSEISSAELHNSRSGETIAILPQSGEPLRFSPDGRFLLTGGLGTMKLWEIE